MSTAIKQDLSLGKLKRAVSSSVSNYTTISSLGQNGGGGTTTVVNNTNNSPVNNNTKTTTLSPLVQVDPVMKAAIGADF